MVEREPLSEILETVDMADYLDSEGIEYKTTHGRTGQQLQIKECPVCGNSGWKVYLNADTGLGNCFAGDHPPGQNFNKWRFIQAHLGASNAATVEVIKTFAKAAGWKPPKKESIAITETPAQNWKIPPSIALPTKTGANLPYLDNRGISAAYAKYFNLRYAPDKSYFRYMAEGVWKFQNHSRRIIIPVCDLDGKLVTFQGRDTTGKAEKKYLFPPGLQSTAFHLFNAMNVVQGTKRVIVNEGVFDVAATKIAIDQDPGLRDIVPIGTFGKHLSSGAPGTQFEKMLTLKGRGVEEVTFMWDGEIRATDDAIEAGKLLLGAGLRVRIAMLSPLKDPNEVAPSEVRSAYYEAESLTSISALNIAMLRRRMNAGSGDKSA